MSDLWALVLGIVFLALWLGGALVWGSLRDAQLQGRLDAITKKDKTLDYSGLACMMYKRGRRIEIAARHRKEQE